MRGVHLRECPLYRGLNPAKIAPSDYEVSTIEECPRREVLLYIYIVDWCCISLLKNKVVIEPEKNAQNLCANPIILLADAVVSSIDSCSNFYNSMCHLNNQYQSS